jgi:hypothetical protein
MLAWIDLRSTEIRIFSGCDEITYLGSALEVLDAISVDIVVGSNRFPELWADD